MKNVAWSRLGGVNTVLFSVHVIIQIAVRNLNISFPMTGVNETSDLPSPKGDSQGGE